MTGPLRLALVALATAAALIPTAPVLAQTATPTPSPSPTPTPSATPLPTATPALPSITASASVIDFGQTVDVTAQGTAGAAVDLVLVSNRGPALPLVRRVIRTATLDASGRFTWTGLRPGESSTFIAQLVGQPEGQFVNVRVRRTVSIGIQQPTRGVYVFSGRIERPEAGVQVTMARLDSETRRVAGVASTSTTADGRYELRTSLPVGLAGYYALTEARSGLDAGRSRLYGLLVNTRPDTPAATQSVSLDVGRSAGSTYVFSGAVFPGRSVPVTLARIVDGRLVGVAGGRSAANGGYVFRVPVGPGTHFFQVVTATARSRVYGLVVRSTGGGGPVVYENCTEARSAGAAPVFRGEPGYGAHLDRDDDGIGCE